MPPRRGQLRATNRPGPSNVLQRLFQLPGLTINDVAVDYLQPTAEVRGLRPWEEFDEQIVRVAFPVFVAAGGAGTFATAVLNALGVLFCLDEIVNLSGQTISLRYGAPPGGLLIAGSPGTVSDQRQALSTAGIPNIALLTGTPAALAGVVMARLQAAASGPNSIRQLGLVLNTDPSAVGAEGLIIQNETAVQALSVDIRGRVVLP